jgi:hypothetical protein
MGVVGRPRDWSFRARFVGEFRQRPGQKFLPCEAWQYNTALVPARIYYMRITFAGVLPMLGVDVYRAGHGHMRGRLLGLITVADGSGPEFDIGELTTYVKDALMIAPTMFLVPAVTWTAVDDHSFDVSMSDGGISATSRVFVDDRGPIAWDQQVTCRMALTSRRSRSARRPQASAVGIVTSSTPRRPAS